jgi:ankyrin repeat protein
MLNIIHTYIKKAITFTFNIHILISVICMVGIDKTTTNTDTEVVGVIQLLLDSGSDVNTEHIAGKTALFCALQRRDMNSSWMISVVKILLAHGASAWSKSGIKHALDFIMYETMDYVPIVTELILKCDSRGLNKVDASGWTKLHIVMARKDKEAVELAKCLVRYGAKLECDLINIFSLSKTMNCSGSKKLEFIIELIKNGYDLALYVNRIIFSKEFNCMFDQVVVLLQNYPLFANTTNNKRQRQTVLMVYGKNVETVEKLLSLGVDPNKFDSAGHTIMHYAIEQKNTDIIRKLLEVGMNPFLSLDHYDIKGKNVVEKICDNALESQEWLTLFEFVLNLPVFKKNTTKLLIKLKIFYRNLIIHIANLKGKTNVIEKMLTIIIKSNSSVSNMQLQIRQRLIFYYYPNAELKQYTLRIDPISYILLATHFNKHTPKFINMMFNSGFVMSKRKDNDLNPLSVLIAFITRCSSYKKAYDQIFQLLIDKGVNLESMSLSQNNPVSCIQKNFADYLTKMYTPDALFLYVNEDQDQTKLKMKKLLSHWWCPPLLLFNLNRWLIMSIGFSYFDFGDEPTVCSESSTSGEEDDPAMEISDDEQDDRYTHYIHEFEIFDTWFDFLADYGGIPHGTKMYKDLEKNMMFWEREAKEALNPNANLDNSFTPHMQRFRQITSKYSGYFLILHKL